MRLASLTRHPLTPRANRNEVDIVELSARGANGPARSVKTHWLAVSSATKPALLFGVENSRLENYFVATAPTFGPATGNRVKNHANLFQGALFARRQRSRPL